MRLDAAIRFAEGRGGETPKLFLQAARAFREVDPASAVEVLTEALEAATWAGDLGSGTTAREWRLLLRSCQTGTMNRLPRCCCRDTGPEARTIGRLSACGAGRARRSPDANGATRLQQLSVLFLITGDMLDFQHHVAVADERVRVARAEGALIYLPGALSGQAWSARLAGHLDRAHALDVESTVSRTPSAPRRRRGPTTSSAWVSSPGGARGRSPQACRGRGERGSRTRAGDDGRDGRSFLMTLDLGAGYYEDAICHGRTLLHADPLYVCSLSLGDIVEGAMRADELRTAEAALARLQERAGASGKPGALGCSPMPGPSWPMTLVPSRFTSSRSSI